MADITIIAVNYNTKRFIELCVKSIFYNTTTPFRLVVVDNGSSDGSFEYLRSFAKDNKIHLISRKVKQSASEHGRAIDQVLYGSGLIKTRLVCTIDSDAYAAKKGWLAELNKQRNGKFAIGYEHFRDPHYLHPACMLFEYPTILRIGKPSFALIRKNGQLYDSGVVVSQTALRSGEKLVGARGIETLVPHRWCATRILKINNDAKLDGRITRKEFNEESEKWFARQGISEILANKI